ncbi:MAG: transporter substrate-binding domain-containing protein [Alphaproteobacteria bacterium]|nr:transporter substrate-binding domain-containing protein [Alphaproteobacteria bacterium]
MHTSEQNDFNLASWRAKGAPLAALLTALAAVVFLPAGAAAAWELKVCGDPNRMPFSHADGTGLENRVAKILADEMGATVTYVWFPASEAAVQDFLRTGQCDVMMAIEDGHPLVTPTLAYFRSPFVFIQRADRPYRIEMFDDPKLKELKVGMQPPGGPTQEAFEVRGLGQRIKEFYQFEIDTIVKDVANQTIDVGVAWGPAAGYFAARSEVPVIVLPVTPEFEPPFTPMFLNMVIGFRRGEESIRDLFDIAIATRWEDIQQVLTELDIPLMPLAAPILTMERL